MSKNKSIQITELRIQNFATIESQQIDFKPGFNAIVGETGAGKSLILAAFNILLGNKADKKFLRNTCEFYSIEGTFEVNSQEIIQFFKQKGIYVEKRFTVKRIVANSGPSKSFIDLQSIPATLIKEFSLEFFDIVGQHENQKLLQNEYQLSMIDSFAGTTANVKNYFGPFKKLKIQQDELKKLEEQLLVSKSQLDYIDFQVEQIQKLNPTLKEEKALIEEKELIQKSLSEKEYLDSFQNLINSENSYNLTQLVNQIVKAAGPITLNESITQRLTTLKELSDDLSYEAAKLSSEEFSEERHMEIIDLLDQYQKLKRKFSTDTAGLLTKFDEFKDQKEYFLNIEKSIDQIKGEISEIRNMLFQTGTNISNQRIACIENLQKNMQVLFKKINLNDCAIQFQLTPTEDFKKNGIDLLSTLIRTNPGEDFAPLSKIASGGELSRILLTLRTCCNDSESISIFLFDEVDSGIGGKTALMIGNLIKDISTNSQVIAITHLPQIASYADHLIHVYKESYSNSPGEKRTHTTTSAITSKSKKTFIEEMSPTTI